MVVHTYCVLVMCEAFKLYYLAIFLIAGHYSTHFTNQKTEVYRCSSACFNDQQGLSQNSNPSLNDLYSHYFTEHDYACQFRRSDKDN